MVIDKVVDATMPFVESKLGPVPEPNPLPKYDPEVEAPMWSWRRLKYGYVKPEINPDVPRRGGVPDSDDKPDWRGVIKNNVIPMEAATAYDFGQPEYQKYYWFDTPDYADPFKKLAYSTKFFLKSSLMLACANATMQNLNFNWKTNRRLLRTITVPIFLGGVAASVAVITVANLRGKRDDLWNYVAAGFVAACVTGKASYIKHLNHTFYWTVAAMSVKYGNEQNMVIVPMVNHRLRNLGLTGNSAEDGILSGNFQIISGYQGDPGRDVRRYPL